MTNRLGAETSPYLRQHKDNPVDWYAWGSDAFAEAERRNVPVLLSVGYSACHWCHVMAHECFEDDETASIMNSLFVNVKVDREERPDIDSIYMDAVQAMTGRGGWPMTVFLTPSGEPFYGGTYFPKPTFIQLMNAITDAWINKRSDIDNNVAALMEAVGRTALVGPSADLVGPELLDDSANALIAAFDPTWGGFGGAPKFPSTMNLDFLVRRYVSQPSDELRRVIETSLDAMASGGMYDHLGGGFARYSVDAQWLVPHFEKMLYDQALLARIYLRAGLSCREPRWLQIATETIDFVLDELRHPRGGLFSALDADSLDEHGHSHEGLYYTWTPREVHDYLGTEAGKDACAWYGISDTGNFEGRSIPNRMHARGRFDRPSEIESSRRILVDARAKRPKPGLDDKVITEWNAMMLATISEAAFALNNTRWLDAAVSLGDFLLAELRDANGAWHRSWHEDGSPRARHVALAHDLAQVADGFVSLYEATGSARFLSAAHEAANHLLTDYWDARFGGVFTTATHAERLVTRQKDLMDNATPSANSTAMVALHRLGTHLGDATLIERARDIARLLGRVAPSAPSGFGNFLGAMHRMHHESTEVVIVGDRPDLVDVLRGTWNPNRTIAWGEPVDSPLWADRTPGSAYVCHDYRCLLPATTAEGLAEQLTSTNS